MTDQPRYRIVCADGDHRLGITFASLAEAAERVPYVDGFDYFDCGPHTVEPVEPVDRACAQSSCAACKSGKPERCPAPEYGTWVKP